MNTDLKHSIIKFLDVFEEVFDKDWNYTKEKLGIVDETEVQKKSSIEAGLETIYFISPDATFINPKVEDEINDWGHRATLLIEYRNLRKLLSES